MMLICDSIAGPQSFVTPSVGDSFRTPDGRMIPGRARSAMTAEEFGAEAVVSAITHNGNVRASKMLSASVSSISQIIGANALTENETENVIAIIHAVFDGQHSTKSAIPSLIALLQHLTSETDQPDLKQQLAEIIAFLHAQ